MPRDFTPQAGDARLSCILARLKCALPLFPKSSDATVIQAWAVSWQNEPSLEVGTRCKSGATSGKMTSSGSRMFTVASELSLFHDGEAGRSAGQV
jgi:hypothetical protein